MMNVNTVLNDKELALNLDPTGKIITPWTIRTWRIKGNMPSFSVGKRIFFRLESVLAYSSPCTMQDIVYFFVSKSTTDITSPP